MLLTSRFSKHPRTIGKWRLVPDVLAVTTGQIGNPVGLFILVIADNRLLHTRMRSRHAGRMLGRLEWTFSGACQRFSNASSGRCAAEKYLQRFASSWSKLPIKTTSRSR
jgi:hypothetical protein